MSDRFLSSFLCDDVRLEVGNKMSLMGIYGNTLFIKEFPAILPKLCFFFNAYTSLEKPFETLKFLVLKDDQLVAEANANPQSLRMAVSQEDSSILACRVVKGLIQLGPIQFDAPCKVQMRAATEDGDLIGPTVLIKRQLVSEQSKTSRLTSEDLGETF